MADEDDVTEDSKQAKGGKRRAEKLSPEQKREIASRAARARWHPDPAAKAAAKKRGGALPQAVYRGVLRVMELEIPCYVLSDGSRVIGRTSATELLTEIKGGGALEKYLGTNNLKPFVNMDLVLERMVSFALPEVDGLGKDVKGLPTDVLVDVFQGLVAALEAANHEGADVKLTNRQQAMAIRAGMFLAACSRVGLDALVDEATGYQYDRARDALEVKLKAYLSDEMRKWEKTFPDELWMEFTRLTGWRGAVTKRPKYWGHLVNELIYDALDPDVAKWLRDNVPEPRKGKNYHQWLSEQYGLEKLMRQIWMTIGLGKACETMPQLKRKVAELRGLVPVQMTLMLPPPGASTPTTRPARSKQPANDVQAGLDLSGDGPEG